jgi:hypothetical protein
MTTLAKLIPDVDTLLSMAPDELGRILLGLVPPHQNHNGMFQPSSVGRALNLADDWYPSNRNNEIDAAIQEAWAWLTINMLVLQAPGINGSNGWCVLGRKAKSITDQKSFESFKAAAAFPRELLHPRIRDKERQLLNHITLAYVQGKKLLVGDLIRLLEMGSHATLHGRIKNLYASGFIKLTQDILDGRKKYVTPTAKAMKYYEILSAYLEKAVKSS